MLSAQFGQKVKSATVALKTSSDRVQKHGFAKGILKQVKTHFFVKDRLSGAPVNAFLTLHFIKNF